MYEIFERLLAEKHVTAYKVAKEANITQTALSNWKMGKSTPGIKNLQKIADYFEVTIDYLMGLDMTLAPIDYPTDLEPMYYQFAKEVQTIGLDQDGLNNILTLMRAMKK